MINIELIKKLMGERGISRKALAIQMGITESCLSRVLNGNRLGSLEFLEGLAKAFPDIGLRNFLILGQTESSGVTSDG